MEDANGKLSISEGSTPTIVSKKKIVSDYEGWRMGGSWEKKNGNNTVVLGFVGGFQYLKIKDNRGCDECIG